MIPMMMDDDDSIDMRECGVRTKEERGDTFYIDKPSSRDLTKRRMSGGLKKGGKPAAPPVEIDDEPPLHIDTGDQMKVKQVLDESVAKSIVDMGFKENFYWDNIKLTLMVVACVFAIVAQFYPMPFPKSRPLLGVCCISYFLASMIIQLIVSYIEQDAILTTQPHELAAEGLRVRTQFPRFQDDYTIILEEHNKKEPPTCTVKFSIGEVFDEEGNFYEEGLFQKVKQVVDKYRKKDWDKESVESKKTK